MEITQQFFYKLKVFLRKYYLRNHLKFIFYFLKAALNLFIKNIFLRGQCNICNKKTIFFYYPLDESLANLSSSYNESGVCFFCGCSHRNRVIYSIVRKQSEGKFNPSIYLPAGDGSLFRIIKRNFSNHRFSDYYPDGILTDNKIPHEDLTNLSFKKNSFDFVVSEHVMEHINDPKQAFEEIYRVLRPGGQYIFSIPFEANKKSVERITKDFKALLPNKYHLDPLRSNGALVFNDFSKHDFLKKFVMPKFKKAEIVEDITYIKDIEVVSEVLVLEK